MFLTKKKKKKRVRNLDFPTVRSWEFSEGMSEWTAIKKGSLFQLKKTKKDKIKYLNNFIQN